MGGFVFYSCVWVVPVGRCWLLKTGQNKCSRTYFSVEMHQYLISSNGISRQVYRLVLVSAEIQNRQDSLSHNNILYTPIPFVFFLGKAFTSSQRPRPTSPFSTDSNTSAALSQSQRPRPTKKHKGGRMDQQPALPHRRDGMTDGRCHPFSLVSSLKRCAMCNRLFRLK